MCQEGAYVDRRGGEVEEMTKRNSAYNQNMTLLGLLTQIDFEILVQGLREYY